MRISSILFLGLFASLAACEAPPPPCRTDAARDLRQLDAVIATTRANIDRGYALGGQSQSNVGFNFCLGSGGSNVGVSFCTPGRTPVRSGPTAIDPEVERRKLAHLEARRAVLARQAAADLAACQS